MKPTKTIIVVAAIAVLWPYAVLAADWKPQELLIGKWISADDKDKATNIEFTKDGAFKIDFSADGLSFIFNGVYKLVNDKTLEITTDDLGKKGEKKTDKLSIKSLTAEAFVFLDAKGNERSLKRVIMTPPMPPMPPGFPGFPGFPKKGGFN